MVTKIFMLPKIELKPFKCKLRMAKSTEAPVDCILNGGYRLR